MKGLMPCRNELVDAAFFALLTMIGIYGFRVAFGGRTYLVLGLGGLVLGILLAHLGAKAKLHVVALAATTVVIAMMLGGVVLRDTAVVGFLPSLDTVHDLAVVVVTGWKQLLTTIRPIGHSGNLLALPYLLGLVSGVVGHSLSQRVRWVPAPLVPAAGVVALSILLGSDQPSASVLQGAGFAGVALAWSAVRAARGRVSLVRSNQRFFRPVAALGVIAIASTGSWQLGPHLPGAHAHSRKVLQVLPPFDPGVYASPLSAFRSYTKNAAHPLVDKTLLTVEGLGDDRTVRLATLDAYDGLVWGASNRPARGSTIPGFARVGGELPSSTTGPVRRVSVTIGEAYQDQVWVPSVGEPRQLTFQGPRAALLAASFRYNVATESGIVPVGLAAGDTIELLTGDPRTVSKEQLLKSQPEGGSTIDPSALASTAAAATKFSDGTAEPIGRLVRIADKLHSGAYTDGADKVPSFPGHGAGRLATFVAAKQIVGDDEQYAAAMALMANEVGVPARVVLTGVANDAGEVKGGSVSAGVEVDLAERGWVQIPTELFTPNRNKVPELQPLQVPPRVPPKVVPPGSRPLVSAASIVSSADTSPGRKPRTSNSFHLPAIVLTLLRWVGPPVAIVLVALLVITLLKARRRRRRRSTGPASTRVVMGWAEVMSTVTDLGRVTPHGTRKEQARELSGLSLTASAVRADALVFGPDEPTEAQAEGYWVEVDAIRAALLEGLGRRKRISARFSLRSLLPELKSQRTRTALIPAATGVPA